MKVVKAILMLALVLGVTSIFAGAVSAADQANNQLIVKDENADFGVANQTTGQNESGNVSKIDLNGAVKPEKAVSVENSTVSEPNKDITDIAPVQSAGNSTGIGKETSASDLQSENNRELTTEEMKSIKGKDWIDDAKRFVGGVMEPIAKLFRPSASLDLNYTKNNTTTSFQMHAKVQAASKYKKSKRK